MAALATKYKVHKSIARKFLPEVIDQYGKVRRVDSDGGDTMVASEAGSKSADRRDATFIRVSLKTMIIGLLSHNKQVSSSC